VKETPSVLENDTHWASGLYGLFRLDGGPVVDGDAGHLGFEPPVEAQSTLVEGRDYRAPHAVHRYDSSDATTLLVGEIYGIDALASELGVSRTIPLAQLACTALSRFGRETPAHILGEWSLLHWQKSESRLTLMQAATRRDRLHFAVSGSRIAVASDLYCLARLPWVGNEVNDTAVISKLGIASIRESIGDATIFRNVRQLLPGHSITIDAHESTISRCEGMFMPPGNWTGGLEDAAEQADSLIEQVMRDRLGRSANPITLLSGGLDSSLLATYAADTGSRTFITSVAPPNDGIDDEFDFAKIVADELGGVLIPVFPADNANIYRPSNEIFRGAAGNLLSNRHCLTEAFQQAAQQHGGALLVNGCYGEMTLTARVARPGMRQLMGTLLRMVFPARQSAVETELFHVRLAPHRRNIVLPEHARPAAVANINSDLAGYQPGIEKALAHPNEFYAGALRMEFPYRDLRLLRFFAGLPLALLRSGSEDRLLARELLRGRLPDSIRLRRSGMPASPDHIARLQRQAPDARKRIPVFRNAQIDDWLDLDWLESSLLRVATYGPLNHADANEVQLTAMTAEWLCWWQDFR
jgi:asparagine synthase (glutamine-hydrolysing)